jgi:tetratricopeptide (TPR) repeat protein
MISVKLPRAAPLALALSFSVTSPRVHAQTKTRRAETSKDIIEKAYNLSLQKDRSQAINILVNAIKQENLNGGNTAELKKALQQVSYLFYSDRAQQAYELALSLRKTDLTGAQQKLNEALRMEPDNLSLFVELQRILLAKGDCSAALDGVTKERQQDPFDENLVLLQAQAQMCLGKGDAFAKTKELADTRKSALAKYWINLEIDQATNDKNVPKAKELLSLLAKMDPKYPAVDYWQWRLAAPAAKAEAAQKYLKDCKNISPMTYRQYMTDVNLCRNKITPENAE